MMNEYLCEYDYGMGASWAFIAAPSAEAIRELYPVLTVHEGIPESLSAARYAEMQAEGGNTRGSLDDADFWFLVAARIAAQEEATE